MSAIEFLPSNTDDIVIPYSQPTSYTVSRSINWHVPAGDYELTALTAAFTTANGGYVVRASVDGAQVASMSSAAAAAGTYSLAIPSSVWSGESSGTVEITVSRPSSNTQTYSGIRLVATYQATENPDPEPVSVEPQYIAPRRDLRRNRQPIRVLGAWEQSFTNISADAFSLGQGALTPTACTITEKAGGQYTLTMTHPIDPAGKWRLLAPFALIVAPIPKTDTPFIDQSSNIIVGEGMEAWAASAAKTGFYDRKRAVSYKAWKNGEGYAPGEWVSYQLWNWECVTYTYATPGTTSAWKKRGRVDPTPISAIPQGEVFLVSEQETIGDVTWLTVTRQDGSTGYAKASECAYQYAPGAGDSLFDDIPARELTAQAFRISDVTVDSKTGTVKVTAQHVSYDWSSRITSALNFTDTPLVTAISAIRAGMLPSGVASAPHIYAENTGSTFTASVNRKALTNVILDPDEGLVSQCKARLVRDGYDFFLLKNAPGEQITRGVTIRYGVNLRGVTWRRDYSKMVTRILPIAKDANGDEYILPETEGQTWPYVDSDYRGDYPLDMYQVIQVDAQIGADGLTELEVQQKMVEEAEKQFDENEVDRPAVTLTVDFVLMGETEEFAQYRGLERVSLYDLITVEHPDIGLTTRTQVKEYEWDAVRCRYNKITLGNVFEPPSRTVYGYGIADGEIGLRKLSPDLIQRIGG